MSKLKASLRLSKKSRSSISEELEDLDLPTPQGSVTGTGMSGTPQQQIAGIETPSASVQNIVPLERVSLAMHNNPNFQYQGLSLEKLSPAELARLLERIQMKERGGETSPLKTPAGADLSNSNLTHTGNNKPPSQARFSAGDRFFPDVAESRNTSGSNKPTEKGSGSALTNNIQEAAPSTKTKSLLAEVFDKLLRLIAVLIGCENNPKKTA